jgi:hypothetical protein
MFEDSGLLFRFIIGLAFGFALVRASMGFAGGVNKLTRAGSSALAKALMIMFVLTALLNISLLYTSTDGYNLGIFPINTGLIIGGLMFGFGMALSSCCATGSLTDLASGFSRAVVTIFFFAMGVFLGFYTQVTSEWLRVSWFTSETGSYSKGGVFLPDLFLFDGFNGYLGAMVLTIFFAYLVVKFAQSYEKKFNNTNEIAPLPLNMRISAIAIAILFFILIYNTHKGWSATTAFGLWFANLLMLVGVEVNTLVDFTHKSEEFFTTPILKHSTSVQNFGIIFGAVLALIIANTFKQKFIAGLRITSKGFLVYGLGGLIMGFSTRLSNGCNVGALYTPIAEFSLSGWIYLVVVVLGGLVGNYVLKKYINKTCPV